MCIRDSFRTGSWQDAIETAFTNASVNRWSTVFTCVVCDTGNPGHAVESLGPDTILVGSLKDLTVRHSGEGARTLCLKVEDKDEGGIVNDTTEVLQLDHESGTSDGAAELEYVPVERNP